MTRFTILIPHFKTPKTTAYSVAQFIKYKGKHEMEVIVIDNSFPHDSIKSLSVFGDNIKIINGDTGKINSHGTALNMAMSHVNTEWVICAESDSFPTAEGFLEYYEWIIERGYDCAASILKLSGGEYAHPCGMLLKKSSWIEAEEFCKNMPFQYFPNMSHSRGFDCHLMVHNNFLDTFLESPEEYIELSSGYKPYSVELAKDKRDNYSETVCAFHNGMGYRNEYLQTYGQRTIESEMETLTYNGRTQLYERIGAEPGQFLSWWHSWAGKKTYNIPTKVKWMDNRENQQQESTLMENGFKHLWAGTSFLDMKGTALNDVYEFKIKQIDDLYDSLPEHLKIKE